MRRRQVELLLAFALVACEDASMGLDGPDASGRDAQVVDTGAASDAGEPDAAVDAGASSVCADGLDFSFDVRGFDPSGYEGELHQTPTGVIRLAPPVGEGRITFFGPTPQSLFAANGFWGRLELEQPFWSEARLTLWRLDAAGQPADLAMYAWSGASWSQGTAPDVRYRYEDEGCDAFANECGAAVGLRLVAEALGDELRAAHGSGTSRLAVEAYNGHSVRYTEGPLCPDTPAQWYSGWIAISPSLMTCASMRRDDCIIAPSCVLWGSENDDPGYVCLEAAGACEVHTDPETCVRTTGCLWDPGDCYCPEGADCLCGGGPAPKCRNRCGSPGPCPAGRYCDFVRQSAPECTMEPNPEGRCDWRPTSCAGVAEIPVCGCSGASAQTFQSDCAARQAEASARISGACQG